MTSALFVLERSYCFGPMSIVQDPGCRNDGQAWSRFIGTVVEVLSRCVVLVRPCDKGSKLSRSHGILVEVFLRNRSRSCRRVRITAVLT